MYRVVVDVEGDIDAPSYSRPVVERQQLCPGCLRAAKRENLGARLVYLGFAVISAAILVVMLLVSGRL
jgi:hypothetical protein